MVLNRQRSVRVSVRDLERFVAHALRRLGISADALTISLVSDAEMARWNRAYRGKKGPTDVLSFPSEGMPRKQSRNTKREPPLPRGGRGSLRPPRSETSSDTYLGDIAIAPAVARRNCRRFGRTFEDEMRILILHGILHLMGYDHEIDTGQMDRRERRLRLEMGFA